ncbi:MAG: AAA family ATPase [Promethearchaeota archaeon]
MNSTFFFITNILKETNNYDIKIFIFKSILNNTIIIMTSNIGSEYIINSRTNDAVKNKEIILETLKKYFRPEFLNRIDEIVIFNFLEKEQIKSIVDIQINYLNKTLSNRKIKVELTNKAKEFLAEKGFDPDYGARPLKRAIQTYIQNPLSLKLLEGEFVEGDLIKINLDTSNSLKFEKIGTISEI